MLEEHELIRVTETRIVSGIIEKHYVAAAYQYMIERSLLTPGQNKQRRSTRILLRRHARTPSRRPAQSLDQGLIATSDDAPEQRKFRMWRATSHLPEAQAAEFYARLQDLIDEFKASGTEYPDSQDYGLLIGIFPTTSSKKSPKS